MNLIQRCCTYPFLSLFVLGLACNDGSKRTNKRGDKSGPAPSQSTDQEKETSAENETKSGSNQPQESESSTPKTGSNPTAFFNTEIIPLLKGQCETCHVGPRVKTTTRGPLTIFNAEIMIGLLSDATTFEETSLIQKLTGQTSHTGGTQCESLESTPCKQLKELYLQLTPEGNGGAYGAITGSGNDGTLYGHAIDPADKSAAVEVVFYSAPSDEGGVLLGSTTARPSQFDSTAKPSFTYQIDPAKLTSGETVSVYGYAKFGDELQLLQGSPYALTAYFPKGNALFEQARFNPCSGCHGGYTYETWYTALLSPTPKAGGTATTNLLYRKASGTDHPGGNQCAGTTLCDYIESWWAEEFASP